MVHAFHRRFGVAINVPPNPGLLELRADLIEEEAQETAKALRDNDHIGIIDGLADLVYVVYGAAISLGIDLDQAIAEVHQSNMSKLGADGQPVRRADGKILKGPNYRPPDFSQ
jgi:predicted HAD superfamily Cof-like phosphohydrolase